VPVLPLLALGLAAGILAADATGVAPWAAWPLAGAGLAMGARARGAPRRRLAAAGLLVAAAGLGAHGRQLAEARAAAAAAPRDVRIEGRVAEVASPRAPRWVRLEAVRAVPEEGGADARVPPRLRLYAAASEDLDAWRPGDRMRAHVRVSPLQPARNPGAPDPARRAWRRGLGAGASLRHPALAVRVEAGPWPRRGLHALRRRVADGLAAAGPGAGLLRGLALGDRAALAEASRDAFVRLGLGHSLAVSGLHLAWVAAAVYGVARRGLARWAGLAARRDTRRLALVPAAGAALAYALLAGWGVPVRRALVLLLAAAWAVARSRPQGAAPALGAAALWILVREPFALFEPGAQLSFAAVAALVGAARRAPAGGETGWRTSLRRSATAILATAPLVAAHGLAVAPIALLANALALPWLGGVVLPAALGAALSVVFQIPGEAWIVYTAGRVAALTEEILVAAAERAPAASGGVPHPAWWLGLAALAAAGLALRRTSARVLVAAGVAAGFAVAPPRSVAPPAPRLVVLDVGQGDAALVQGRRGTVLVDAGGRRPGPAGGWDAGRVHVVPALRALGVERLDLVVVTHADADHRGGVPAVLGALPVGEVWIPFRGASAEPRDEPAFDALRAAAAAAGVRVRERGRGSPVSRLGDLRVDPLWPPRRAGPVRGERNARSLVVAIEVGGGADAVRRVLAPGDLEADAEAELVARDAALAADVLLLPHHGSRSSSSAAFLARVSPRLAVASAPCRGRFRMPHPEVRERVTEQGAPLWWTGRDGAVLVHLGRTLWARSVGDPRAGCE